MARYDGLDSDLTTKEMFMKNWIGLWVIGISIIHTVFAFIFFRAGLDSILKDGIFNTVGQDSLRAASVWFLLFGFLLFILGLVLVAWEKSTRTPLPVSAAWGLLFLGILGIVLMPVSGFWLIFPPVVAILLNTRRGVAQTKN